MQRIITNVLGPIETNCYFIVSLETNDCVIIDPADNADYIIKWCKEMQIEPKAVLLTHGHYDHTGAVGELKERLGIPVYAGENEKAVLADPAKNGALMFAAEAVRRGARPVSVDVWLKDGEVIEPAGFPIKVIAAPGHTAGGVCYYIEATGSLFSGDVLFLDCVGRTDFPTGSQSELKASVKNKLFVLPEDAKVYPGHGEPTTIKHEKHNNPINYV